jgi:hypothetical protein
MLRIDDIEGVPGGEVNILGGHSIGHSKKKLLYEHVSYSERFPIFVAQYCSSLPVYEQSQQPTDASHRFTCFRHWRITVEGRKIFRVKFKILRAKYRKPFGIGHMFI